MTSTDPGKTYSGPGDGSDHEDVTFLRFGHNDHTGSADPLRTGGTRSRMLEPGSKGSWIGGHQGGSCTTNGGQRVASDPSCSEFHQRCVQERARRSVPPQQRRIQYQANGPPIDANDHQRPSSPTKEPMLGYAPTLRTYGPAFSHFAVPEIRIASEPGHQWRGMECATRWDGHRTERGHRHSLLTSSTWQSGGIPSVRSPHDPADAKPYGVQGERYGYPLDQGEGWGNVWSSRSRESDSTFAGHESSALSSAREMVDDMTFGYGIPLRMEETDPRVAAETARQGEYPDGRCGRSAAALDRQRGQTGVFPEDSSESLREPSREPAHPKGFAFTRYETGPVDPDDAQGGCETSSKEVFAAEDQYVRKTTGDPVPADSAEDRMAPVGEHLPAESASRSTQKASQKEQGSEAGRVTEREVYQGGEQTYIDRGQPQLAEVPTGSSTILPSVQPQDTSGLDELAQVCFAEAGMNGSGSSVVSQHFPNMPSSYNGVSRSFTPNKPTLSFLTDSAHTNLQLLPPTTSGPTRDAYLAQDVRMLLPGGPAPVKLSMPSKKELPTPSPRFPIPVEYIETRGEAKDGGEPRSKGWRRDTSSMSSSSTGSDVIMVNVKVQATNMGMAEQQNAAATSHGLRVVASDNGSVGAPCGMMSRRPSVPIPANLPYSSITPPLSRDPSPSNPGVPPHSVFGIHWKPFGAINASLYSARGPQLSNPSDGICRSKEIEVAMRMGARAQGESRSAVQLPSNLASSTGLPRLQTTCTALGPTPGRPAPPVGYILVPNGAATAGLDRRASPHFVQPMGSSACSMPSQPTKTSSSPRDSVSFDTRAMNVSQDMIHPGGVRDEELQRAAQRLNQLTVGKNQRKYDVRAHGQVVRLYAPSHRKLAKKSERARRPAQVSCQPPVQGMDFAVLSSMGTSMDGHGPMIVDDAYSDRDRQIRHLPEIDYYASSADDQVAVDDLKPRVNTGGGLGPSPYPISRTSSGGRPTTWRSMSDSGSIWDGRSGSREELPMDPACVTNVELVEPISKTRVTMPTRKAARTLTETGYPPLPKAPPNIPRGKSKHPARRASTIAPVRGQDRRKHKCSECPLAFDRAHDLKRHFRLHSGERPYTCPNGSCGQHFERNDQLRRHIERTAACRLVAPSLTHYSFGTDRPKKRKTLVMNTITKRKEQEEALSSSSAGGCSIRGDPSGIMRVVQIK